MFAHRPRFRPHLDRLEERTVPSSTPISSDLVFVGQSTAAGGVVRTFGADGIQHASFTPYPGYRGAIRVARADVNGDGILDNITGTAENSSHVKVFDGTNGGLLLELLAFPGFTGGVSVGGGDVDGDGRADLIVGAGAGADGGHVKVFSGATGAEIRSFFAFSGFAGGVEVAGGDVTGDGRADIIVGTATGSSHVKAFDGRNGALVSSTLAFDAAYVGGISVAAGDLDGDGKAEIVVGARMGSSNVKVYSGGAAPVRSFYAFAGPTGTFDAYVGGVSVAVLTAQGQPRIGVGTLRGESFFAVLDTSLYVNAFFSPYDGGINVA